MYGGFQPAGKFIASDTGAGMFFPRIRKDQTAPSATSTNKSARRSSLPAAHEAAGSVFRNALDDPGSAARPSWDFGKVTVFPSSSADDGNLARQPAAGNHAGTLSVVKRQRYTFSAVVPRALPVYHDAVRHDEPKPARTAPRPGAAAVPAGSNATSELWPGEAVLFPDVVSPSTPVPSQSDSGLSSSFKYTSAITKTNDAPDPGDFGTTRPNYKIAHVAAVPHAQSFDVTGDINADITFSVTSLGKKNIASDSDPNITQTNYPDVVKDLTPSPATVTRGGGTIYKNQPPRNQFWAEDITIKHERFHADEDVSFGQQGVTAAQNWMNTQRVAKIDDIALLIQPTIDKVRDTVVVAMALPGRELRATPLPPPLTVIGPRRSSAKETPRATFPNPRLPRPRHPNPRRSNRRRSSRLPRRPLPSNLLHHRLSLVIPRSSAREAPI